MKAVPKMAPEELDRLRGLARAAWARLQREDLDSTEHAAAQEEYERARDDLHDVGCLIVIGADDCTIDFELEECEPEEYNPDMLVESIDPSREPRALRSLRKIVDLKDFLERPICIAIGRWALKGLAREDNKYWSLCGMSEREPGTHLCVQHNNQFPVNNPGRVPNIAAGAGATTRL